ncbi:MAG: hypothetical protein KJO16_01290 [Muriicola sp.]|nr:hypothetical protein [Muriicola sp.]NNK11497.1 hypothetical protein [Flavobacteriaceae bacterium]
MNNFLRIIPWKKCYLFSFSLLPLIVVSDFYGLYTNKFYFLKIDNYIFAFLVFVHLYYLNMLLRAEKTNSITLNSLRTIEFAMYAILPVYLFKMAETTYILTTYFDHSEQIFPATFVPVGTMILLMQALIIFLTFTTFRHRKDRLGPFRYDRINGH